MFPKEIDGVVVKEIRSTVDYGWGVLADFETLEKAIILSEITEFSYDAFSGCTNLKNVEIPNTLKFMEDGTFYGCTSLESITIPESVTSIGWGVFNGCTSLKNITIPNGVTYIGGCVFNGCTSLESIIIPSSVTNIGYNVVNGCTNLKNIYYTGTEAEWNAITISSENEALKNATITYNYGK